MREICPFSAWLWQAFLWRIAAPDNSGLVHMLQQASAVKSPRVAAVMEKVDRANFVRQKELSYVDNPLPIGYNATISAPHMHGACLDLLEGHLQPGARALDVGSGFESSYVFRYGCGFRTSSEHDE